MRTSLPDAPLDKRHNSGDFLDMRALPRRVHHPLEARARFGARFDALVGALRRADPPADQVIEALADRPRELARLVDLSFDTPRDPAIPRPLRELVDAASAPPAWVDWRQIDAAGRLFFRAGPLGGLVLALRSLVAGYLSPAGNKPLVFSGRLKEQAPRRLAETGRFVTAVCAPGGLRSGGDGVRITLKVRLMHAQVRRLLLASDRWRLDLWSLPINQHDMLATVLLFSVVFTDGLRLLGLEIDEAEGDTYLHLWRYVGHLIGVEPELLPWSEAAARRDVDLIELTQGTPDEDSRVLTESVLRLALDAPGGGLSRHLEPLRAGLAASVCRRLIGAPIADQLGLPRAPLDLALPALTRAINGLERARGRLTPLATIGRRVGEGYWKMAVDGALAGQPATFEPPQRLAHP
jgi:hypothetical protein